MDHARRYTKKVRHLIGIRMKALPTLRGKAWIEIKEDVKERTVRGWPNGTFRVLIAGFTSFLPYITFLTSLRESSNLDPCTKALSCVYSQYFPRWQWVKLGEPEKIELPTEAFRHEVIWNGGSVKDWISNTPYNPVCANDTSHLDDSDMNKVCHEALDASSPSKNFVYEQTSSWTYQIFIYMWALTRIWHDIRVLRGKQFLETIVLSHISTICLFIACTASIFMAWNALELLPVKDPEYQGHKYTNCACWYRFGFVTSMLAFSIPFAITIHLLAKIEDTYRAYLGGDYLITRKFHIAYRLTESRKPTGSLLGLRGLGADTLPIRTDSHLPTNTIFDFSLTESLWRRSMISWGVFGMIFTLALCWSIALPTFILRSWSLFYDIMSSSLPPNFFDQDRVRRFIIDHSDTLGAKICFGALVTCIAMVDLFLLVGMVKPSWGMYLNRLVQVVTTIPSLAFITDKRMWEASDPEGQKRAERNLIRAFEQCPEVANKERIVAMLHLDAVKDAIAIRTLDNAIEEVLRQAHQRTVLVHYAGVPAVIHRHPAQGVH